jgi:hypothetical protein
MNKNFKTGIIIEGDSRGGVRAVKATGDELKKLDQQTETTTQKLTKFSKNAAATLLAAGTAAAGAVAVFTEKTVAQALEVERLAKLSGLANAEFQQYAAGAKLAGIEQEKLADIFKDTNDKIGDFLQTGGGPLKDFFENIAEGAGVTAEQFRNLSGPQALELYVSTLEKANLSQNEMTFYMEAIANDATLLLPLLRDNAAGFDEMSKTAELFGAVMSDELIEESKQLNENLETMQLMAKGVGVSIAEELIPKLNDVVGAFIKARKEGKGFFESVGDALDGIDAKEKMESVLESETRLLEQLKDEYNKPRLLRINPFISTEELGRQYDAQREKVKQMSEELQRFIRMDGAQAPSSSPVVNETPSIQSGSSIADSGVDLGPVLRIPSADEIETIDLIGERYEELAEIANRLNDTLRTPQEIYQDEIELLNELRDTRKQGTDEGLISYEEYTRGVKQAQEKLDDSLEQSHNDMSKFAERAAENMQDSFADFLFDPFESGIDGMLKGFLDVLRRMAAEAAAAQIFQAMGLGGGGAGGGLAGVIGSLFSFDGGGYTGSGSRSGGVDGKGGFPAILHPQETVIDHTKSNSASMGVTIINQTSAPIGNAETRISNGQMQIIITEAVQQSRQAVANDMYRGGNDIANAIESNYSLERSTRR